MLDLTRRSARRRIIATTIVLTLIAQSLAPILYGVQTAQAQGGDIFLPNVASPNGFPQFRIINPLAGATVSGFTVIAVESTGPARITEVSFQAGTTDLSTDDDARDGFQSSFDASALPAGSLELTVTATGPGGSTTQTRTVTVVPNPPSTATVGPGGGVLATDIGSVIGIRPGSVPPNTQITVEEKSQADTTAEHGLEWDDIGVTFLGAQEISASNPISEPLSMVVSAGFANRVQPNQVVVNYQLAPDANGDGISEIIVVNTASLAPNGDVFADPIPQPFVEESDISAAAATMSGSPGEALILTGGNFNEASVQSNVARFTSDVDGSTAESPILAVPNPDGTQTLHMVIPRLPAGGATVVLENLSTFFTVGPLAITIGAPKAPSKAPLAIITDAVNAAKGAIDNAATIATAEGFALAVNPALAKAQWDAALAAFEELADSPTPAEAAALNDMAVFIESTGLLDLLNTDIVQAVQIAQDYAQATRDIATGLGLLGAVAIAAAAVPAAVVASPIFIAGAVATVFAGGLFIGLGIGGLIPPSQPGSGTTGMGSAPPPGGNGGGNVGAGGGGSLQASAVALTPGRFLIKLFSGANSLPFTGMTDAGGYFFIPLIPEGENFTAVAYDTSTGATRTIKGVGPPIGESVYFYFDFVNDDGSGATEVQIGDTIADSIDSAGEVDLYSFDAQAGQVAFFDVVDHKQLSQVKWIVSDLVGNEVFNHCLGCGEPGLHVLEQEGRYLMTVGGGSQTGAYTLTVWNVPPPDIFGITIGDIISDSIPGPGAGNIESPGVRDYYIFEAAAGQRIFMDKHASPSDLALVKYRLIDSTEQELFDTCLGCTEPGVTTLTEGGTYTLTVGHDRDDGMGTYQLQLWNVPPADEFTIAIGDVISDSMPGPGAGNIESPGVEDVYTFQATAGQRIFVDKQAHGGTMALVDYKIEDSTEQELFDTCLGCTEPGVVELTQGGTYTLTVGSTNDDGFGLYRIQLWDVPAPDVFAISIGDTISNGVPGPGAGNIESPGATDIYTFTAPTSSVVNFNKLNNQGAALVDWKLFDSTGAELFDTCLGCTEPGEVTLEQGGTYTMTVGSTTNDGVGTYSIQLTNP